MLALGNQLARAVGGMRAVTSWPAGVALFGSCTVLPLFGCGQSRAATRVGQPAAGIEERDAPRRQRVECPLPYALPEHAGKPARGEAVAFHRWSPAFWAGTVEESGGAAYLEQYDYRCGPRRSRSRAEAEWNPGTGALGYTVRTRHLVIRLEAQMAPGRRGALGEVVITDIPMGREQSSIHHTKTLVMLGRRSTFFMRVGKMYACSLRALGNDLPSDAPRGPLGDPERVTSETVIGEWTGFALEEDLLVSLRVGRGPEPARLALTRLEPPNVASEAFELDDLEFHDDGVVLRSTSSTTVTLEAELHRSREGGSGQGKLTLDTPDAAERTLQVQFFFARGESWMAKMLELDATATDAPCFRRTPGGT